MGIYFWYLLHNKFSLAAVHKKLWRVQIESSGKVGWLFKDGLRMLLSSIAALDHFVWPCPPLNVWCFYFLEKKEILSETNVSSSHMPFALLLCKLYSQYWQ